MQCHFPVIFEKRIVALKLLQCSLRKTNTESGFVRGVPSAMVTVRVGLVGVLVAMWSSFPRRRLDWAAAVLFSFILVGCAARPGTRGADARGGLVWRKDAADLCGDHA